MLRALIVFCAAIPLTGCMCLPEGGETVMSRHYFGDCWNEASKGPNNQTIFSKP